MPLIPLNFPVPATKDKVDRQQWLPCADALEHVTRQDNEAAARAYAEAAMAQSPDLRVVEIHARPWYLRPRDGIGRLGCGVSPRWSTTRRADLAVTT